MIRSSWATITPHRGQPALHPDNRSRKLRSQVRSSTARRQGKQTPNSAPLAAPWFLKPALETRDEHQRRVAMRARCGRDVENIARCGLRTALLDLLGEDLRDCLEPHRPGLHVARLEGLSRQRVRNAEVWLFHAVESEFVKPSSVSLVV